MQSKGSVTTGRAPVMLCGSRGLAVRAGAALLLAAAASPAAAHNSPLLGQVGQGEGMRPGVISGEVRLSASIRSTPERRRTQQILAAGGAIKIRVREEGWVRVPMGALLRAGLNPRVDPRFLQLYVDGAPIPARVRGEDLSGRIDATDALEFYGVGLDTPFTDTRTYWLVAGTTPGRRVPLLPPRAASRPAAATFPATVERKERTVYFAALQNGEAENWFGPVVTGEPVSQDLEARGLAVDGGRAVLEVALQGVTEAPGGPAGAAPNHRVAVAVNGTPVGEAAFSGRERATASFRLDPGLLREGRNRVTLSAVGGEADVSLLDAVRLTYPRVFAAEGGRLRFTAEGGQAVTVGGFRRGGVRVLDVTDPDAVVEVAAEVVRQGSGFAAAATAPGAPGEERDLVAFEEEAALAPASIEPNRPSAWATAQRGAQMVIVTHATLRAAAERLAAARLRQGLTVAVIDVEDLYDELSFGHKTPAALKAFFAATASWERPPRFALLMGDASIDPRDYLGRGSQDLVPTGTVASAYLEAASDEALAERGGDGLAPLAIGRLPARTARQASQMVAKILSAAPGAGRSLLLVTDRDAPGFFRDAAAQVRSRVPAGVAVAEVAREDAEARGRLRAALAGGPGVVNYLGHGSVDGWAGDLLTAAEARTLKGRPALWISMTCLNAAFTDPRQESLGEALLDAPGGAVAVWASTALTPLEGQTAINRALVAALYGGAATLGEAIRRAKAEVGDLELRRTWVLLGDPSMPLR